MARPEHLQTCSWVGSDPSQWKRIRWAFGLLALAATLVSGYSWLWRVFLKDPAWQLPSEVTNVSHFLWLVSVPLLFMAYVVRLFVYHTIRVMCPIATPTLSDRVAHSQLASRWIELEARKIHERVTALERDDGLRFGQGDAEEFALFLASIASALQRGKGIEEVIAVFQVSQTVFRDPYALDVWDPFIHTLKRNKKLRSRRRLYYLMDFSNTYDQDSYSPAMESITSSLEVTPKSCECRVLYKDADVEEGTAQEELGEFYDTHRMHYLAVRKDSDWTLCVANVGSATGGFQWARVYELSENAAVQSSSASPDSKAGRGGGSILAKLREFDRVGRGEAVWHIGDDERTKRHVYMFEDLKAGDSAVFCDWEIAIGSWDEDRLRQIGDATKQTIDSGGDVRRLFVIPRENDEILRKAAEEAMRQVPGNSVELVEQHFGYIVFPDDTQEVWPKIKQMVRGQISAEVADFALYMFAEKGKILYVNNFDGASRETELSTIAKAESIFERLWTARKLLVVAEA
jgi:hypothetical protein